MARVLGLLDADALLRHAGRRRPDRGLRGGPGVPPGASAAAAARPGGGKAQRRPLADGVVEQDGEAVLARAADPATDPALPLRAAAAAAQAGLPLAPRTLARLADCPPLPVPWPPRPGTR